MHVCNDFICTFLVCKINVTCSQNSCTFSALKPTPICTGLISQDIAFKVDDIRNENKAWIKMPKIYDLSSKKTFSERIDPITNKGK